MIFSRYLQDLRKRHDKSPAELAAAAGMNAATVYKAESGESVRWPTVRDLYGPLCQSGPEKAELLLQWAMSFDPSYAPTTTVRKTLATLATAQARDAENDAAAIAALLTALDPDDRELLTKFCTSFSKRAPTRGIARAWLQALEEA